MGKELTEEQRQQRLEQVKQLIEMEDKPFSDAALAELVGGDVGIIRQLREELGYEPKNERYREKIKAALQERIDSEGDDVISDHRLRKELGCGYKLVQDVREELGIPCFSDRLIAQKDKTLIAKQEKTNGT